MLIRKKAVFSDLPEYSVMVEMLSILLMNISQKMKTKYNRN